MSLILGILAQTGVPPTPAAVLAYESIATVTVGSGGSSSISFTSIPSTFKHLQLRITEGYSSALFNPKINFNSDTGSNYSWHYVLGDGSAAAASGGSSQSFMYLNSNTAPSTMTVHIVDILDYQNTNKYKTIRVLDGYDANGSGYIDLWSGNWRNTAAVNTIAITNGTFAQYSHFALYGIKG
jgi:hypothetical protein